MFAEHLRKVEEKADKLNFGDFPKSLEWIGSKPLSLKKELKGKLVILCFWTSCCLNCRHLLSDLNVLSSRHKDDPVVFIGVYSPKFNHEVEKKSVFTAIEKEEIQFPVILDPELTLWDQFGVKCWPTVAAIGPKGNLLLSFSGEGNLKNFDSFIKSVLQFYPKELFSTKPIAFEPVHEQHRPISPLKFPAGLAVDKENNRLIIADTGHHRLVITTLKGALIDIIGSGEKGFSDGQLYEASFNRPVGIAYHGHKIYVADSANHAIRVVDLKKKMVTTLAGNGKPGKDRRGGGKGSEQLLNTPWDIAFSNSNDRLYISMPGLRQIWVHEFATGRTRHYIGNGAEDSSNGNDLTECAFAMPTAITRLDSKLFVLDSESSSLRQIDLFNHKAETLAGNDPQNPHNLFYYGDSIDKGKVKFQYPLALKANEEKKLLFIADTYNNCIKTFDLNQNKASYLVKKANFFEPGALALSPDEKTLYVADTANHLIRTVDVDSGEVETLKLKKVPHPQHSLNEEEASIKTTRITLSPIALQDGHEGQFVLRIKPPAPYRFAAGAPSRWKFNFDGINSIELGLGLTSGHFCAHEEVVVPFRYRQTKSQETLTLEAIAYYSGDNELEECKIERIIFEVPLSTGKKGPKKILLEHTLGN